MFIHKNVSPIEVEDKQVNFPIHAPHYRPSIYSEVGVYNFTRYNVYMVQQNGSFLKVKPLIGHSPTGKPCVVIRKRISSNENRSFDEWGREEFPSGAVRTQYSVIPEEILRSHPACYCPIDHCCVSFHSSHAYEYHPYTEAALTASVQRYTDNKFLSSQQPIKISVNDPSGRLRKLYLVNGDNHFTATVTNDPNLPEKCTIQFLTDHDTVDYVTIDIEKLLTGTETVTIAGWVFFVSGDINVARKAMMDDRGDDVKLYSAKETRKVVERETQQLSEEIVQLKRQLAEMKIELAEKSKKLEIYDQRQDELRKEKREERTFVHEEKKLATTAYVAETNVQIADTKWQREKESISSDRSERTSKTIQVLAGTFAAICGGFVAWKTKSPKVAVAATSLTSMVLDTGIELVSSVISMCSSIGSWIFRRCFG